MYNKFIIIIISLQDIINFSILPNVSFPLPNLESEKKKQIFY